MKSESQKMLAGELYDPFDGELVAGRTLARDLCPELNATTQAQEDERRRILRELFANVWVGGAALILAGVRIGDRAVIGAGSVVTRDVPQDVFAAGNPCRVICPITA